MDTGIVKLLVLHEDELRAASRLLKQAVDAQGSEAFGSLAQDAMNACIVALHGLADNDGSIVMVSATKDLIGKLETEESP